ncbi:MAG: alpha/beta hydrolase fold domain-containing protein [Bacteroidales bacterium]
MKPSYTKVKDMAGAILLSIRTIALLVIMLSAEVSSAQLLVDNFAYPAGVSLTAVPTPGYTLQGTGTVPLNVASEGLFYTGYASSGIGNSAQLVGPADGMDPFKQFVPSALTTGSVYVACMVKITSATVAGEYFLANKIDASTSGTASVVRARVYIKSDGASGISFGIAKGTTPPTSPTSGWTAFNYQLNTTYLLVYKYTFVIGTTNDNVDLFINPVPGMPEPTPSISYADITTTDAAGMRSVMLTQRANGPSAMIDGLRVATTWTDAVAFDNVAPVATFVPANGAIDVLRNVMPTITFDAPVIKADGTPLTNADLASLVVFKTTDAAGTDVPFSASINDSKTIITLIPSSELDYSQSYYIATGPVKDGAGNLSGTQSSTFTTLSNTISTDASLNDLKIDGATVAGFASAIYTYSVELPFGTTIVPTVTATPTFGLANVAITPAVSLPGSTSLLVTAQDGITQLTYTVAFTLAAPSNDANLSNLRWLPSGGSQSVMVTGFSSSVLNYTTELPDEVSSLTLVATTAQPGATLGFVPPANLIGTLAQRTGTVVVTAQDGVTTKTYSVVFNISSGMAYHFKEGFAAFPPASWSFTGNISNSASNGVGLFSPGLSCPKFKWTAPLDGGTLISPSCNTAGILEFYVRVLDADPLHQLHLYVEKSTDGGSSWTTISTDPMPMDGSTTIWHQVIIPVNDNSSGIMLSLRGTANTGTTSQGLFYIDDISLTMNSTADASLSDLKVGSTTISGFSPTTYSYNVILPAGTSTVPIVTATATQPASTILVSNATSMPGTTTVLVTAPDGISTNTYRVNFSVALGAPYSLSAIPSSATQINLSWSDNNSTEAGFRIERKPDNGLFTQVATTGADVTTSGNSMPGLDPGAFIPADRFAAITVTSGVKFADVINYKGVPTELLLDIYQPTGDATQARPVIIWIHGGGFRTDSYRTQGYIVDYSTRFAKRGYVCMSIDYRLRLAADMPTQASEFPALQDAARDANAAISWIKANAATYHIDPNLIFIAGGSAGGRTAQTVCQFDGPDPTAISPPENQYLTTLWNKTGIVANATLWGGLEPEMRGWVYPSPPYSTANYLQSTDVPSILVHGDADVTILPQNSIDLHNALDAVGVTNELHIIPGATHSCLGHETEISAWLASFFAQEWSKVNAKPKSYTYRVCAYNVAGNSEYSNDAVANRTLNLALFLEGLYNGNSTMLKAQGDMGDQFPGDIADQISVELHNAANYATKVYSFNNVDLSTVGNASIVVPATLGSSYYITVKHRNSITTTCAFPVSFANGVIGFAFDSPEKAFGSNLLLRDGSVYAIYGGDINQDGIVDSGDMAPVENSSAVASNGYLAEDANGDGLIDGGDMSIVENNAASAVASSTP